MKRSIPIWSVAVSVVLVVAAAAGVLMSINPTADKEALLRLRAKPGSASVAPTGLPRGTPITHEAPAPGPGSRQKPGG